MRERKDSIGLTRLLNCKSEIRKANGQLTPGLAWEMADLIEFSRRPNVSVKTRIEAERYMNQLGIKGDLANKLTEIRQDVISDHAVGSNLKQVGVERVSLLLMENLY